MAENEILKDYLATIGQYGVLTPAEEIKWETIYHDPNSTEEQKTEARDEMFNHNAKLVVFLAKRYRERAYHMSFLDLIQEGNLGLLTAIDRYDPTLINPVSNQPYRFSTLAATWIRQSISKAMIDKGKMIRNPAHIVQQLSAYNKKVQELTVKLGREPTNAEVAKALNVDENTIVNYQTWSRDTASLDFKLDRGANDNDSDTLVDLVPDNSPTPDKVYAEENKKDIIDKVMSEDVDPRTEVIMRLRYGLGKPTRQATLDLIKSKGWDKNISDKDFATQNTLDVIGEKINLTRERVRQIEKKTLADLANNPRMQALRWETEGLEQTEGEDNYVE